MGASGAVARAARLRGTLAAVLALNLALPGTRGSYAAESAPNPGRGGMPPRAAIGGLPPQSRSEVRAQAVSGAATGARVYPAPGALKVGVAIAAMNPSSMTDTDFVAYRGTGLPSGLTVDASTGSITGAPDTAHANPRAATVTVTDRAGNARTATIHFPAVAKGDQTLAGFSYSAQRITYGDAVPTVTAPSGAKTTLRYSATPSSVCSVNSRTGALAVAGTGSCTITATAASDSNYYEATATAELNVTAAVTGTNLVTNGGFENGRTGWAIWGAATVVKSHASEGSSALRMAGDGTAQQTITGLLSDTRYTLIGSGMATGSNAIAIGVRKHGDNEKDLQFTAGSYTTDSLTFTTGFASTRAEIYVRKLAGAETAYVDNIVLIQGSGSDYVLEWSDEFNGSGEVDSSKWASETGFIRNHELQWYQSENSFQSGGHLVLEGREETFANPNYVEGSTDWKTNREFVNYTSGSLTSEHLAYWQYQKIVVRAKVTNYRGTWPAIWTKGKRCLWPSRGEVDIMENYGATGTIAANFAWGSNWPAVPIWDAVHKPVASLGADWASEFHLWELAWDEDRMSIYLDGVLLNDRALTRSLLRDRGRKLPRNGRAACPGENPFQQPHHLILNLALGANSGGSVENLSFPTQYLVDYVRVYGKDSSTTGNGGPVPTPVTAATPVSFDSPVIAEGQAATLTVALPNADVSAEEQTIALDFAGGTATMGTDYTVSADSLTLAAGATSVQSTVTVLDDTLPEDAETIRVAARRGGSVIGTATLTIEASDPPSWAVSPGSAEVAEGATATLTVSAGPVTFAETQVLEIRTAGTAGPGDYLLSTSEPQIPVGANSVAVQVTAVDDAAEEDAETVRLIVLHRGAEVSGATVTIGASDVGTGNATLADLSITGGRLGFRSDVEHYAVAVYNGLESTTVTATPNDPDAAVNVSPEDADGDPANGHQVPLADGANAFAVTVVSEDGLATKTYTVTVTRSPVGRAEALRRPERDLNELSGNVPYGLWSGDGTLWLAMWSSVGLVAFDLLTQRRLAGRDIGTASEAAQPSGLWSDGTTVWVTDYGGGVYAYRLTDGQRVPEEDLAATLTAAGNETPTGLWSDGTTLWVADHFKEHVFAYRLADKVRDEDREFAFEQGTRAFGLWSDGTTVWTSDFNGGRVVAYDLAGGGRDSSRGFNTSLVGNNGPLGLWSDGQTLWVGDRFEGKLYAYALEQETSEDATLASLTLSGVSIGAFDPVTTGYTASVGAAVSSTTVAATPNHSGARVVIADAHGNTVGGSREVSLSHGANEITVTVTAEDGETTRTYTVTVTRQAVAPAFTVTMAPETIAEGGSARLAVAITNGVTFAEDQTVTLTASGTASAADYTLDPALLTLRAGATEVSATLTAARDDAEEGAESVTVTASHGGVAIGAATVTITSVSRDATLSALSLSGIDIGTFSSGRTAYTASVGAAITSTTVTAAATHPEASVSIRPGAAVSLAEGANEITVTVTAEDGETTRTYTVTVTRQAVAPAFTVTAAPGTIAEGGSATLAVAITNGVTFVEDQTVTLTASGTASAADYTLDPALLTLRAGTTEVSATLTALDDREEEEAETVVVSAVHDGTTVGTATVTIAANEAPLSNDATLSALSLSGIDIETFSSDRTAYTASVGAATTSTTVTAAATHPGASVSIRPGAAVSLAEGANEITVTVTAEDGETTRTYTVTVTVTRGDLPVVSVAAVASPVPEGERAEFTVSRTGPTREALVVPVRWARSDREEIHEGTMPFQAGVSSKTPYFQKRDDRVVRDDLAVTLTLVEGDGYTVDPDAGSAEVVVEDDDEASFAVLASPGEIAEGESATVRVGVTGGVTFGEDQTIEFDFGGSTATQGADFTVSPEPLTLRAGASSATAELTAVADGEPEGAETVTVAVRHDGVEVGSATVTIVAGEAAPLTAEFRAVPKSHDGDAPFTLELHFSEEVAISYRTLRDVAFEVAAGAVRRARRLAPPSNRGWEITVEPHSEAAVVVVLPATGDCGAAGAVCTSTGQPLSHRLEARVPGPGSAALGIGFSLAPDNASPSGIWSNGETAWVADLEDARLYAYRLADGERQPERDVATAPEPMGLWSDGATLWVASLYGGLKAHRLAGGARLPGRDLALTATRAPAGVWSDGATLWVSEWLGDTVNAYRLMDGGRRADRDIRLAEDNLMPTGLWSDGATLWVADWRERVYAYRLSDGGREPGLDVAADKEDTDPTGLWSGGGTLLSTGWKSGEVRAYRLPEPAASGGTDGAAGLSAIADPRLRAAIQAALGKAPGEAVSEEELAALEALDARHRGIRDLAGLETVAGLRELDLGFNPLADLGPLAALPALASLNLDGAAPDLIALAPPAGLRRLSLRRNTIDDLHPLAGLEALRELDLGANRIGNLQPLASLGGLETLELGVNRIRDLRPLASLAGLRRLSLRNNEIADLWPLASLEGLAELDVGGNRIEDLRSLTGLAALRVLRADRNRIADLWPLASLTGLETLELRANRIRGLQPLAGLARLATLRLDGNGLEEVHPLSALTRLRELGLAGNAVTDLRALADLAALSRLDLRGNTADDLHPLAALPALQWVHVGGSRIEDLAPLLDRPGITVAGRDDRERPGDARQPK